MCRIAGIINTQAPQKVRQKTVQLMCDLMAHGGPDDEGISDESLKDLTFGHRRLALLDLSAAGHQPMQYKNLSIVFNGEIYNFAKLKSELQALGFEFNTATDTEVILAAFEKWNTEAFAKFEGMFAFALFDAENNKTYLVRDQMGIKPLYYSTSGNKLVFASEIKAFKIKDFNFDENSDWKLYFLTFGHLPEPFTTLKDVYSLKSSNYLIWNHDNSSFEIKPFSFPKREVMINDREIAIQMIKTSLEDAVSAHLIADAPVGVFLSGGIDSSLLTLIADQQIGKNLKTLSINFAEQAYAEGKYQDLIAEKTQGKHQSYLITQADLETHLEEIINSMDQPSNDAINSWFVNKCAKENGLKAVLSGIGADELFGGYPSFKRMNLIKKLKMLPPFLLRLAEYLPSEKLKRIYFLSYKNPIGEYLFLRGFFTPSTVSAMLHQRRKKVDSLLENFPIDPEIHKLKNEERASWMETNLFMRNQLLKDTDFMSMHHAIEVRVPFLDQNLIHAIYQINSDIKFKSDKPKGLLVDSFIKLLPEAIWNRPKMGFTFPLQNWLRENKTITDSKLYESNPLSAKLMKKFVAGKLHWSKAYALYQVFKIEK